MYDKSKAEEFWTRRVSEVNELRAVLSYNLPDHVNAAYSEWELGLLLNGLGNIAGKKVLDLGCGVGRVTIELLKAGAYVTSVDNSQKMLDITTAKSKAGSFEQRFAPVKSSANEIAFPDETFDVVVCVGLLEHLPPTIRNETLVQIHRVLKKGGLTFIIVNNEQSVFLKSVSSYRMDQQQDTGYFVGIIGMGFLTDFFASRGAKIENLGSNFLHSYFRHTFDRLAQVDGAAAVSEGLMKLALAVDLDSARFADLGQTLADQFLVKVTK
jgi:ubiquinone/menaquinone biosynthesis C-methylase UbiE